MTAARGLRNNNPGNIRHGEKWQGLADEQSDSAFCTFKSPQFGIRAMCRILLTYKTRGLTTVEQIISRWAPDNENDTGAYIESVCAATGLRADEPVDVDDTAIMRPLLKAIIKHENGSQPYSDAVIDDAMRLAGIANAKPIAAAKSPMVQGGTIAGIGTSVAAAAEVTRQVSEVRSVVDAATESASWLVSFGPSIAIAFILAGGALALYAYFQRRRTVGL